MARERGFVQLDPLARFGKQKRDTYYVAAACFAITALLMFLVFSFFFLFSVVPFRAPPCIRRDSEVDASHLPGRPASKEGPVSAEEIKARFGSRVCCCLWFRQRGSVWGPSRTAPFHVLRSSSRILTTLPWLARREKRGGS